MRKKDVVEKIKKLLAKADKNKNDSGREVEVATLMAQRLMVKYDIEQNEIDLEKSQEIVEGDISIGKHRSWKYKLIWVIADNFRCKHSFYGEGQSLRLRFYGCKNDVAIANELYTFLYKVGNRNAVRIANEVRKQKGNAKGVYNSYTEGFVNGLSEKLEEQCRALVIVISPAVEKGFEEYSKEFIVHKSRESKLEEFNGEAYAKGLYDGKYSLNRQELTNQDDRTNL